MMIVAELGFDLAPLIAGTSIVGVALGFGAQNVVKDFLSGMFMIFEDQYGVGDVIDFEKASGTVEAVGLRTTRLRDINGTVWYVRNGEVVRVGNKSQGYAQVVLDVPIDAYADVERASSAMLAVAQGLHDDPDWADIFLGDPELQGVESMTLDETVIRLVVRVRPLEQWKTARELRGRIRERLDQLHIAAIRPARPIPTIRAQSSDSGTPPVTESDTFFDAVGGEETFRRLVDAFYAGVAADPVLRALYPEDDLGPAAERLRLFLIQYWGGPTTYSQTRGHPRLRMRHAPFAIGSAARDAWLRHMRAALDVAGPRAGPGPDVVAVPGRPRPTRCATSPG